MIEKYRTQDFGVAIDLVEVERETEHSVWIRGVRSKKKCDWQVFHDNFEDAKNHLIKIHKLKVESAKYELERKMQNYESALSINKVS